MSILNDIFKFLEEKGNEFTEFMLENDENFIFWILLIVVIFMVYKFTARALQKEKSDY